MKYLARTTILYHVTPGDNALSIQLEGIDPEKSQGKQRLSWYVSRHRIVWAIAHASWRHDVVPANLSVCAVLMDWEDVKSTRYPGIFTASGIHMPESIKPAALFMDEILESDE